jgi:hypothetical protein
LRSQIFIGTRKHAECFLVGLSSLTQLFQSYIRALGRAAAGKRQSL